MWILFFMFALRQIAGQETSSGTTETKIGEPLFAFASPLTGLGPVDPDPFGRMVKKQDESSPQKGSVQKIKERKRPMSLSELIAQASENKETKVDVSRVDQDILNLTNDKKRNSKVSDQSTVAKSPEISKLSKDVGSLKDLIDPALEAQILGFNSETNKLNAVNGKTNPSTRSVDDFPSTVAETMNSDGLFNTVMEPKTSFGTNTFFSVTPSPLSNMPFLNDLSAGNSLIPNDPKVVNTDSAIAATVPQSNMQSIADPSSVFGDINIPIDFPLFPDINNGGRPTVNNVGTTTTNVLGPINGQFLTPFQGNLNNLNNFQTGNNQFSSVQDRNLSVASNQIPTSSNALGLQIGGVTSQANLNPIDNRGLSSRARMVNGFPPNVNLASAIRHINQPAGSPASAFPGVGFQRLNANIGNVDASFTNIPSNGNIQGVRQSLGRPVLPPRATNQFGTSSLLSFSTTNNFESNPLLRGSMIRNIRGGQSNQNFPSIISSRTNIPVSSNRNSAFEALLNRRSNGAVNRNFIDSLDRGSSFPNFPPLRSRPSSTAVAQSPFDTSASNGNFVPRTMDDFRWNLSRRPTNNPVRSANRALFARISRFSNRPNIRPRLSSLARPNRNQMARSSVPRFQPVSVDQFDTIFSNRVNGIRNSRVSGLERDRTQQLPRRNLEQFSLPVTTRSRSSLDSGSAFGTQGAVQDAMALFSLPGIRANIAGSVRDSDRRMFLSGLNQVPLANTFLNPMSNNRDTQSILGRRSFSSLGNRERNRPTTVQQRTFDGNRRSSSLRNGMPPFIPFRADVANFITPTVLLSDTQMKSVIKERLKPDTENASANAVNKRQRSERHGKRNRNISIQRNRNGGS